jgi:hypothetical protein
MERLTAEFNEMLKAALAEGYPSGETTMRVCETHKRWPCFLGSLEARLDVGQMYVGDQRVTAYYDRIAAGAAEFLRDAVLCYCK